MLPIRFRFLGLPSVELGASSTPLACSRPLQLVAHLALTGAWQGRDQIARMFWPDRTNKVARSNLRNLLCKLPSYASLETTDHALRLRAPSDVDDFEAALDAQAWEAAAQIGAAELLAGYDGAASEPYLLWLNAERDARLRQWKTAVQALLAQSDRPFAFREALVDTWALRCPLDEEAVQARIALAHERQKPVAAAQLYREFEARLRSTLGVGPSIDLANSALRAPANQAALSHQTAEPTALARAGGRGHTPPLIGRRLEMRQLFALMKAGSTPLITVTGPGGVGKSTLLAASLRRWLDDGGSDAFMVDVSAAPSAEGAAQALAAALGVAVPQGATEIEALADALGERAWLLLIDGAEQPGLATTLTYLMERCPRTRWVIAARQRLHLDNEQLLVLDGFPLPDADETDAALLGAYDGVRFLADAIARTGRPVDLAHDAATLAAIVRAVDGLPLALRLLGKLTHLYSLGQILDSVRPQADSASAPSHALTLPELLPPLLASVRRSWSSLSSAEQNVLARLSVFPADFEVDAGRWVGLTALPVITSLIDRSLLRAMGAGRLSMHAAIRSCVQALSPQPAAEAATEFLTYFAERLRGLASLARTRTVRPLLQFVDQERIHLDHAWLLALARRDHATLLSLQSSVWFLDSGTSSAMRFSARCVDALQLTRDDPTVPPSLQALLLACAARDAVNQGRPGLALSRARDALRVGHRARHFDATLLALNTLFYAHLGNQNHQQATLIAQRQEALLRHVDEGVFASWVADCHATLAIVVRRDLPAGMLAWEQCARMAHRIEDCGAEVHCLINIAMSCHRLNDPDRALGFEAQAFAIGETGQVDPASQAKWLSELALWHVYLRDVERAQRYAGRAALLASSHPQMQVLRLKVALAQGSAATAGGDLLAAKTHLVDVLDALRRDDLPAVTGTAFATVAAWFLASGQRQACLDALHQVLQGKSSNFYDLKLARAMLAELGEAAPAAAPADQPAQQIGLAATIARQRMVQLPTAAAVPPAAPR